AASDTVRFPAQKFGRAWAPTKLYRLLRADEPDSGVGAMLRVNVGEYAPLLGSTYAELAAESRARQRSQGAVPPGAVGASWERLRLLASRAGGVSASDEVPGERSLFDGVD